VHSEKNKLLRKIKGGQKRDGAGAMELLNLKRIRQVLTVTVVGNTSTCSHEVVARLA
jgi:hypothetical protein